jgi:MFS family permease
VSATRWLVDESVHSGRINFVRPGRPLLLLGVVAFCAFLLDGAAYHWSALHVRIAHAATPGTAAAAFTAFAVAMTLGRLAGDRLIARLGRVRTVRASGVVAAAGSTLALAAPTVGTSIAGWAVYGLGLAVIAPAVLGAAPGVSDLPAPVAITAVTTLGYLGSFTGPLLIGTVAGFSSLPTALAMLVGVALLASLLARPALRPATPPASRDACRTRRRPHPTCPCPADLEPHGEGR